MRKSTAPDGTVTLSFKSRGTRVRAGSAMPVFLVILLFPVSCTVSSPAAFLFFDPVASRNEFQYGVAMIWAALSLLLWAGIVRAYNHRRSVHRESMTIVPREEVRPSIGRYSFQEYGCFAVRTDATLGFRRNTSYVAAVGKRAEYRITMYMSDGQARAIAGEIENHQRVER